MSLDIDNIYVDNAATTKVSAEVLDEMLPYFTENFANPSGLYLMSQDSRAAVEFSREKIAKAINSSNSEIIFTSGGTESDNLAFKGLLGSKIKNDQNEIIISTIEHHAIIHPAEQMKELGYSVFYCPINKKGFVEIDSLNKLITKKTKFISVMYANNEIGTIQRIKKLVEMTRKKEKEFGTEIIFHTDAVQAIGKIQIDVKDLGVDALSISAHKFSGPKGIGALFLKDKHTINPLIDGGGQERQNRSGTENVPNIVGFGKAIELAEKNRLKFCEHTLSLKMEFINQIKKDFQEIIFHTEIEESLPNIINFSIPNIHGEPILIALDFKQIMASSGSACSTASTEPSHVLLAKGIDEQTALGSIRISLGINNTFEEIKYINKSIIEVINDLKS